MSSNHDTTPKIITRFPPSPTGHFHVGSARTALYNFIFAKKHSGIMKLRFEDTDMERSRREHEEEIRDGLDWLGIEYHAPIRQSERTDVYKRYLKELIDANKAYISTEEKGERSSVIRFKNPNTSVLFNDLIRGEITFDTTELGDFVIAKSMDEPLYHLAVVVDDHESGVTHVIRGEDGISNTPRQILIQEAIGAERPAYAHIPLVLGSDKSKLSKRHGAVSLKEYREQGYLPEAMVNYLALLGWHPKDDREVLPLNGIIEEFEIENVQKGGAIFNSDKLNWINKHYIRSLGGNELEALFKEWVTDDIKKLPDFRDERIRAVLPALRERLEKLGDIQDMAREGELEFYFEKPGYHAESLRWKGETPLEETREHLTQIYEKLETISNEQFSAENIKDAVWEYATEQGRGAVLWPMRYALSGMDRSPSPFELAEILGKTETLERLEIAVEKINQT